MALTKCTMANEWAKRKAQIDEMFCDGTSDKAIFEELCNPVYSGDEFENVPGIIYRNTTDLIDAACHIIIADCAISCMIDSTVIPIPDHTEILVTIFAQLKRDNVNLETVYEAINNCDTKKWFNSSIEKCALIRQRVNGIWTQAKKYFSK